MVSTRQAGKTRKPTGKASSPADSGDEYEERTPQPSKTGGTKRARASKTAVKDKKQEKRRKTAKLSMLPGVPIDILYEIFSLVHPRELMRISWTSKTFNGFLTRKSSRHVWQASFETIPENEKPPPCPSEITEMAYANLLYGQLCMNCASSSPQVAAWRALVRLCGPCVDEMAVNLLDVLTDGLLYKAHLREALPTFLVKFTSRPVTKMVLRSDSKKLLEEFAAAGESSQEDVIQKWKSLVCERKEFSDVMLALERRAERAKEDARADVQKRRIERIWEKLSEEGWREEIAANKSKYERGLMKIKGVTMVRPLGEKAWAELREPLHKFMREESERVHVEFKNMECRFRIDQMQDVACSFRYSLPHPHDFSPSTADLCWIPEVRKAIVDGTDEEFQIRETEIRSRIPELSTTWLEERRRVFLKLLPQDSPSLEHLSLATTLFDCMKCREFGMRIEDALSHACEYRHDDEFFAKFSSINSANIFYYDVGAPWDSGLAKYRYSAKLSAIVREIVLGCGEDPDTITTKEMNRKHHRFAFFDADGPISVLSWFQASEHRREWGNRTPYRFLRPDELPEYVPDLDGGSSEWYCLRCWGTREPQVECTYFSVIKDHLADSHQIENPTEEDYSHRDPNHALSFRYRPKNGA